MRMVFAGWVALALLESPVFAAPSPDPKRFEPEISAFEAKDKLSSPPIGAILFTGSSSIRKWHPTLAADMAPLAVLGRGFGGSIMDDLLFFAPRVIITYKPKIVVIYEGDNDIAMGMEPENIRDAFQAIQSLVHTQLPKCQIYALSIKPSPSRWDKWPAMKRTNELIEAVCAGKPWLHYVDVATVILGKDGKPRLDLFIADQLHLSDKGYEAWTTILKPLLLAANKK